MYHLGGKPIARSTLARVNEKQPYQLYEALFGKLLKRCQSLPGQRRFRFKNPLYSLDASLIDLSINLFPWARNNATKASVKLHVGLNHERMIPEFVWISDGKQSELIAGQPKGNHCLRQVDMVGSH